MSTNNSVKMANPETMTTVSQSEASSPETAFVSDKVIPGADLYFYLQNYITDHLEQLIQVISSL